MNKFRIELELIIESDEVSGAVAAMDVLEATSELCANDNVKFEAIRCVPEETNK